jgi:hypothetical protein
VPIINVQNNETLLKQFKDELEDAKKKNERLINEKNELKILNNQLENKLMNLQTEYVEEHAANAGTIDLLDVETSERMRLERELNELRVSRLRVYRFIFYFATLRVFGLNTSVTEFITQPLFKLVIFSILVI